MKGDATVIDHLNKALRLELTAVNQYWLHFRLVEDWGYAKLAKKERAESIEEMQHADKLAARIIFLEGLPNMQQLNPLRIGQTVQEVLEADLAGEYEAQKAYSEAREVCRVAGDYVSMDLFEALLKDEEGHINFLESQLKLYDQIGAENYGQLQADATNEAECRRRCDPSRVRSESEIGPPGSVPGSASKQAASRPERRRPPPPPPGELDAKAPRRPRERRKPGERRKLLHDDRRRHPGEQLVVRRLVDEGRAEGAAFQRWRDVARDAAGEIDAATRHEDHGEVAGEAAEIGREQRQRFRRGVIRAVEARRGDLGRRRERRRTAVGRSDAAIEPHQSRPAEQCLGADPPVRPLEMRPEREVARRHRPEIDVAAFARHRDPRALRMDEGAGPEPGARTEDDARARRRRRCRRRSGRVAGSESGKAQATAPRNR